MGGVEGTTVALPISFLDLYPPLKRSCYPSAPMLIPKASSMPFFSLIHCLLLFPDAYRYSLYVALPVFPFSFHTQFVCRVEIVLYTYIRKSAVSGHAVFVS